MKKKNERKLDIKKSNKYLKKKEEKQQVILARKERTINLYEIKNNKEAIKNTKKEK